MNKIVLFSEKQRLTQWYIWIVPLFGFILCIYALFTKIILDLPLGDDGLSDIGLVLVSMIPILILFILRSIYLDTSIYEDSIFIRLSPFLSRTILFDDISKIDIIKYSFVGYGLRMDTKFGNVYNIKGNIGLKIIKKDGERILIGTQKKIELDQILKKIKISGIHNGH